LFGCTSHLHIHHIIPVSVAPHLAADWTNMCVLCRKHHYHVGHLGKNWQSYNADLYGTILVMQRNLVETHAAV